MPITFTTTILRFASQGEKTGWSYIEIPAKIAEQIKPGVKKSFRVKGTIDDHVIKWVALLPMGEGHFILPINAAMRKGTGKRKGDKVKVSLHYFFEPVAYAVLCGKNEQRKGGETYKGNDYKFCIDGSK